jgi:hypothetical protein
LPGFLLRMIVSPRCMSSREISGIARLLISRSRVRIPTGSPSFNRLAGAFGLSQLPHLDSNQLLRPKHEVGRLDNRPLYESVGGSPRGTWMAENSSSGATLPIAGVLGAVAPQTRWSPTIGPPTRTFPVSGTTRSPRWPHRAVLDPSAIFKPQMLGRGRLPRTAEAKPSALPR